MKALITRLMPVFAYAALFSLAVNLLLLVPPLYMLQIFDRVLMSRHAETLALLTLAAVAALVVMMLLDVLRSRLLAGAALILDKALGPQVIERLVAAAARGNAGELAHGLRDVGTLRSFLTSPTIFGLFDAPWLPFFLLIIAWFHPVLGVIAVIGALLLIALAVINERATRRALEAMQHEGRRAGRFIDASMRNADAVVGMGMLGDVTRRWAGLNEPALAALGRSTDAGGVVTGASKLARQVLQVAMLCAGAWLVLEQQATAGVMMAATIILGRALAPVESVIGGWRNLVLARAALRRLGELIDNTPPAAQRTELPAPRGALAVENVSYRYPKRQTLALRGISFSLAPGESLGLLGPSASGKTTLTRLLIGIWGPLTGTVRLDGADVASWPRSQLGVHLGYLPQDVELFPGTVAENIARLAAPSDAAVVAAAQRARCHEMILRLPQGYDSEIGDTVAALSPGQLQRIALARALYGDPRFVVLDEPNSNLDGEGEEALLAALRQLKADGVTLVIVAHGPALLAGIDKLLVLREGAMEMSGATAELMPRLMRGVRPIRTQAEN
jgi:PrtD family type I secretion system ABC transporter